ncbi:MAG: hypothetical protein MMC33_004063 [Icmadophila ericetorum]|nr:hypothetical protein [Icmadophila ericetorum]
MDVQASDLDIQEYVRGELWRTGGLLGEIVSKDSELPTTAARRIAKKSDGVFQIAVLHVELLRGVTSRTEIDELLDGDSAQSSLDDIYDKTIMRIRNQNKNQALLSMTVLKRVLYFGSMYAPALLHALAMDPVLNPKELESIDDRHIRPERAITMYCAGLVVIEPGTGSARFRHYTTAQYFRHHERYDVVAILRFLTLCRGLKANKSTFEYAVRVMHKTAHDQGLGSLRFLMPKHIARFYYDTVEL